MSKIKLSGKEIAKLHKIAKCELKKIYSILNQLAYKEKKVPNPFNEYTLDEFRIFIMMYNAILYNEFSKTIKLWYSLFREDCGCSEWLGPPEIRAILDPECAGP